jgi:hypothetical protein
VIHVGAHDEGAGGAFASSYDALALTSEESVDFGNSCLKRAKSSDGLIVRAEDSEPYVAIRVCNKMQAELRRRRKGDRVFMYHSLSLTLLLLNAKSNCFCDEIESLLGGLHLRFGLLPLVLHRKVLQPLLDGLCLFIGEVAFFDGYLAGDDPSDTLGDVIGKGSPG